ncbi:hypothetical protein JOM56_004197 [Amanita muscaria]
MIHEMTENVWLTDFGTITILYSQPVAGLQIPSQDGQWIQPPPDQRSYMRLGVFYFCMCDDNVKLVPFAQSPVLQIPGLTRDSTM